MKRENRLFLLTLLILLVCNISPLLAQVKQTITGVVQDDAGNPVPYATVSVKGALLSVLSDENGRYSINVDKSDATLVFSSVGYTSKEAKIGGSPTLNITISQSATDMNEVVVTALGVKRDQKSLGYAVQQVQGKEIVAAAPLDLAQGLMGKVAGLNISQGNGLENSSSRIVIRGNNSLTRGNQPLIVVDGAIMDNKSAAQSNIEATDGIRDWGNYMSYLNMDNVESVSVLKGPNAAALYGARGANGVIQITTKKGSRSKGLGIDYNFSTNFSNAYRFQDLQNEYGGGFAAGLWTADPQLPQTSTGEYYLPTLYGGSGFADPGSTGINGSHGTIPGGFYTADIFSWFGASSSWGPKLDGRMVRWWDGEMRPYSPQPDNRKYYYKQGNETRHNIAFSSGNDFGTIRMAISRINGDAVVPNTNHHSTNISLGSNLQISKALSAEVSIGYNQAYRYNTPEIGTNNSWAKFSVYGMSREYKPLEMDYYKTAQGAKFNFGGGASYPHQEYSRDMFWYMFENNSTLTRDELIASIKLNAEFTPWLNASARTATNLISSKFEMINKTTSADGLSGGAYGKDLDKDRIQNTDIMLTAHKENLFLEGFNASITGGFNSYYNNSGGIWGRNSGTFLVPNVYSLNNIIAADRVNTDRYNVNERRYEVKSESLLSFINLSYKDYLFLDLTGRRDINSTLTPSQNTTFYPSASLSFVFTEGLNMSSSLFSYGKLRLSYGRSANASNPYGLGFIYNVGTFGGQNTNSLPGTLAPDSLGFQTSKSVELGTSLGFFQDRLNLDVTYYNIVSYDQIMDAAIPASSGANQVTFNSGQLRSKGWDFIINAAAVRKPNFSWDITLNAATNQNIVESLAEGVLEQRIADVFGNLGVFMKVTAGDRYGTLYGTDFVLTEDGQRQVQNVVDGGGVVRGTKWVVSNEAVPIGNAASKFTGGIGNTFRYKNFSLYGLVDFKIGGDIYSFDHSTAMGSGISPATVPIRKGGGLPYTFPDGTTANVGVIMEGYNVDDGKTNDRVVHYIYDIAGSYTGWTHLNRPRSLSVFENSWAKLRELTLSYRVPKGFIEKTKVFQDLSVSFVGRNLFYLYTTLPDNLNPEGINGVGNGQGMQWSSFPGIRTMGFRINAQF